MHLLLQILLGARASCSSLDRLPKWFNALYEEQQDEYEELSRSEEVVPDEAATLVAAVDGLMVATRERDGEQAAKKAGARAKAMRDSGPNAKEACCVPRCGCTVATASGFDTEAPRMPEKRWPSLKKWVEEELDDLRSRNPSLLVMAMADGSRVPMDSGFRILDSGSMGSSSRGSLSLRRSCADVRHPPCSSPTTR